MFEVFKKRKVQLFSVLALIVITLLVGISYAFYSGVVTKKNMTETKVSTAELGLIYTGVTEINEELTIPGEYYEKTFTVENISDEDLTYNIYIEDVTNEFRKKDLVYTLSSEDGQVVSETTLPRTKEGKSYLFTSIDIKARELQNYTLKIEYKYSKTEDQSGNMGAEFSGTVGIDVEKNVAVEGKYLLIIDPNGGEYEDDTSITLETGETYQLLTPTKEGYDFTGWETESTDSLNENVVTMGEENITVKATWKLSDDVVARIEDKYYTTIQNAINAANSNDEIVLIKDTTEKFTNDKNVLLNLDEHTVTGQATNTANLTIIDGTIENIDGSAIINSGIITLGQDDGTVSTDSVKIIGTSIGIEQNGTFNFYDGFIEGVVGVTGTYNDKPENYYVFVDHNNDKDCQKIYLVETPTLAVVKTVNVLEVFYFNLQDAINTTVITNEDIYAIRDFEAAYTLEVPENKEATLDLVGYTISTGYTITNNGTLNILDSATDKGSIQASVTIENNGTLNIKDTIITETTSANVITNTGILNVENSTITALDGYAVYTTAGTISMDENSYLKANKYSLYNKSTEEMEIMSGNYAGIYNEGVMLISGGTITNGSNDFAIYNKYPATLNITDCKVISTKNGIFNNGSPATLILKGGTIEATQIGINNVGTFNMYDGTIKTTSKYNATVYNTGTMNVYDGYIYAEDSKAIDTSRTLTINGGTIISKTNNAINANRKIVINGGSIAGGIYGIYTSGTDSYLPSLTIGTNDETIDITTPIITGGTYGLYLNTGTAEFNDGIIKGQTAAYYGTINTIPEGTIIKEGSEEIDGATYTTNYLIVQEKFVRVGDTEFNSLQKAVDSITSKGTITFINNAVAKTGVTIPSDKEITIDLAGYEYETTKTITNEGILILLDSSDNEDGSINAIVSAISAITNNGTLTIENGNIKAVSYDITNKGTITINGGTLTTTATGNSTAINSNSGNIIMNNGIINTNYIAVAINRTNMEMNGGTITSTNSNGINLSSGAVLTINDGTIIGGYNGIYNYNGTVIVKGGSISADANCGITSSGTYGKTSIIDGNISGKTAISNNAVLDILGGNISATNTGISAGGTINIKGGSITGENYGINCSSSSAKLIIGTNDENINITTPVVIGNIYGLYIQSGSLEFYDGILKGQTAGYSGIITTIPDSTTVINNTEIINEVEYKTNYLEAQTNFVKVEDVEFNSLQKAINSITSEGTLEFIASNSAKVAVEIPSDKKITMDLKGYKYETTQPIINNGELSIIDNSDEKNGIISMITTTDSALINNGTLTLESGTIESLGNGVTNNSALTINGGTISTSSTTIDNVSGTLTINDGQMSGNNVIQNAAVLVMNGGSISATGYGIYGNKSSGSVTINDGIISSTSNYVATVYVYLQSLEINGGLITGSTGVANSRTTVNINGGIITGTKAGISLDGSITITAGFINGGTYGIHSNLATSEITLGTSDDTIDTTAPVIVGNAYGIYSVGKIYFYDGIIKGQTAGYYGTITEIPTNSVINYGSEVIEESTYTTNYLIMESDIVVNETTNTNYVNLQTAINEASSNDTLKLLKDISIYYDVAVDKKLTLDLSGYSLYTNNTITNNSTLNLTDSTNSGNSLINTLAAIGIIVNNGEMLVSNISFENMMTNYYIITNNTGATLNLENVTINSKYGVSNSGTLSINGSNITTNTNNAVYNTTGSLTIDGGSYTATGSVLYIYSTATDITITNVELTGEYTLNIYNGVVECNDSVSTGVISNGSSGTLNSDNITSNGNISNSGTMTIKNSKLDQSNLYSTFINNSGGTINLDTNSFDLIRSTYSGWASDTILMNQSSGIMNLKNNNINLEDTTSADNYLINNSGGTVTLDNNTINANAGDMLYGIYNLSNGILNYNSGELNVSAKNLAYGLYSKQNNYGTPMSTILSGSIIANSDTEAYGIYVDTGTVTLGEYDGSGTENATISVTDPIIKGIGTTNGIGVKKVNGYFKYYDGIIYGSTNAKPDTTTEVEYNYEAQFFTEEDTGYEYCVLKYMK